jgi:hypothetical protein
MMIAPSRGFLEKDVLRDSYMRSIRGDAEGRSWEIADSGEIGSSIESTLNFLEGPNQVRIERNAYAD